MSDLNIAIVQFSPLWENIAGNLSKLDQVLKGIKSTVDLVVLPEMFNSGFSMNTLLIAENMDGKTNKWLAAQSYRFAICGSMAIKENNQTTNRLCVYDKGICLGFYDKKYLFGMAKETEFYVSGTAPLLITLKGFKIQFFICYDLRFPEWIRNHQQYDMAVFVASWPQKRILHWEILLKARAIENQAYVIAVNRVGKDFSGMEHNGQSQMIDAVGEILAHAGHEETVLYGSVNKTVLKNVRKMLPFLNDIRTI